MNFLLRVHSHIMAHIVRFVRRLYEPAIAASNITIETKSKMEVKNCHERVLSRIFHVSLTTGIVLILVLKDTGMVDTFLSIKVVKLKISQLIPQTLYCDRTSTSLF